MRVLMVNHPRCEAFQGGDLVQMRQTAAALRFYGVRVEESFALDPDATGFDLAHVFNLRTIADTPKQLAHLKRQGARIVLSPLYLNPAVGLWGSRAVTGLLQDRPAVADLPHRLADLRDRRVRVSLADGTVLTADAPNRPHPEYDRLQREALQYVDLLLVNSLLELHALLRTLQVTKLPFAIAPVGVDPALFLDATPDRFVEAHKLRDFVLQVGRIEGPKNQLMLAAALRNFGRKLVLIGSARQPEHLDLVRHCGPSDLVVLPHLKPELLASAYAAARVHVLPSWSETCGLVNLEAALAGCSVVAGTLGYEVEYLGDLAYYCDPADLASIETAVRTAWDEHARNGDRRRRLRQRILNHFTWEKAAEVTFQAYCRVLSKRA
jgi:glycosyltransferase involved in cell wall biosynthesis